MEETLDKVEAAALEAFAAAGADAGRPPTVREVGRRLGISPEPVFRRLEALREKGYLVRDPGSRGLRLSEAGRLAVALLTRGAGGVLPILGRVAAGTPLYCEGNCEGVIAVDRSTIAARGALFALNVRGDSMTGDAILDGDIVVVREQPRVEPGEMGVVVVGEEATVKHVHLRRNGMELRSSNPKYSPIRLGADAGTRIVGKVVAVIRPRVG